MKKFIYSLSLAMAFGVAANATPSMQMERLAANPAEMQVSTAMSDADMVFERLTPDNRKEKRRGATKAEDFVGSYKWSGRNLLASTIYPNEGVLSISINEEDPSKMVVMGLTSSYPLDATFDASTGHLRIPNQYILFNTYYNEEMWFWNFSVYNGVTEDGEEAYGITMTENLDFYFTLQDDGSLRAGNTNAQKWNDHTYTDEELLQDVCMAALMMPEDLELFGDIQGFFLLCMNIKAEPFVPFEFIEDEWEELGMASFTDPWFAPLWQDLKSPTFDVPVYYNKNTPARYLLYNPYGYGGDANPYVLYGANISDKVGYIIFSLESFDCVVVEPLVYSITIDDRADEQDPELPTAYYCTNSEGYNYYLQNATFDDIIIYFDQNDLNLSSFNQRTGEVTIYNPEFNIGDTFDGPYGWQNYDGPGYIALPTNWADGVDSILGEDLNIPAVYYNLQGQRVANPEKGQLLIVRHGNKASKVIF